MRKFILPLAATVAVFLMVSCSEKFNVAAPYKDVTIVYGFLDMNDTAHYIRIQKGFLDQNKSAVSMAKTADSNFYANLSVRIERYNTGGTNGYHDSIHLNRVDLTAEGYPKEPGTFFDAPNYAYKFTDKLDPQYFYRLKITNLTTGRVDSSDAPIVNENYQNGLFVQAFDDPGNPSQMAFFSTAPGRYYELDINYIQTFDYNFNGQNSPAGVAEAIITFNWDDVDLNNVHTHRQYDFNLGYKPFINGANLSYQVDDVALYNAIASGMGKAPANTTRLIDSCNITVYASTPDFYGYEQATELQGTGLTGGDISPVYTNIKGDYAIGLFTSRAVHSGRVKITDKTVDSLIASPLIAYTNLKGTVY